MKIRVRTQSAKDDQLGMMTKIVVPHLYHYASIVKLTMSNIHNDFDLSYCYRQTRNVMIPRICHIQCTRCVNEESLTGKQLCQSTSLSLPSSHKNVFFRIFISFHHMMIVSVRQIQCLFFIDGEISREVEMIQLIHFSSSTSYDDAILRFDCILSNFIFSEARDIEIIISDNRWLTQHTGCFQ